MTPGSTVDVSPYGGGVQITPGGRTARLERSEYGQSGGAFGDRRDRRHDVRADRCGTALTGRADGGRYERGDPVADASHQAHDVIWAWAVGRSLGLSGHALAETYSVLTRLPGDARVRPEDAVALIDDNFPDKTGAIARSRAGGSPRTRAYGVSGGATYDGLVALAAREHGAVLVTRDARARSTYEAVGARVELFTSVGPTDRATSRRTLASCSDELGRATICWAPSWAD